MSETMPDLVQYVVGYRAWRLVEDLATERDVLRSTGAGRTEWQPGVNVASCDGFDKAAWGLTMGQMARSMHLAFGHPLPEEPDEPEHEPHFAPDPDCGCGLYALYAPDFDGYYVDGAVVAWGKIEVHRDGFRAEKAKIVALAIPDRCATDSTLRQRIERVGKRYGAEVVPACDLVTAAREHGIEMPESMKPEEPTEVLDLTGWQSAGSIHFSHGGIVTSSHRITPRPLAPGPVKKQPPFVLGVALRMVPYLIALAAVLLTSPPAAVSWPLLMVTAIGGPFAGGPIYRALLRFRCWFDDAHTFIRGQVCEDCGEVVK